MTTTSSSPSSYHWTFFRYSLHALYLETVQNAVAGVIHRSQTISYHLLWDSTRIHALSVVHRRPVRVLRSSSTAVLYIAAKDLPNILCISNGAPCCSRTDLAWSECCWKGVPERCRMARCFGNGQLLGCTGSDRCYVWNWASKHGLTWAGDDEGDEGTETSR